ncbi:MAG: hypothetical protein ACXWPS_18250 [Ktedonobacteraceae bacterium]
MSKQTSKQGQGANKQSNNQNAKQANSANKQIPSGTAKQSNSATKQPTRQAMKQERREEERQRQLNAKRRAARNKRILISSLVAVAVLVVAAVSFAVYSNSHKNASAQNQATPTEQVVNAAYPPVDGIYCDALEQTAYHIHAHLTIYMNGKQVAIPQGIGIASDQSCFYWLHTHTSDGVVHIEFPNKGTPTLGNFLDIWGQSFNSLGYQNELASSTGWKIYVDGKQVTENFNQLVLQPHQVITIAYNSPNITPDTSFNWPAGE